MKTYRIYREPGQLGPTVWYAYEVTFFHRLFGPPFGFIGDSCSTNSADDCEINLKKYLKRKNAFPKKVEREISL